jgi:hypothetical protein
MVIKKQENVEETIRKIINEKNYFLKFLITLKFQMPNLYYFNIIAIIFKFLGLFLISNMYLYTNNDYSKWFVLFLKKITIFGLIGQKDFSTYCILCYIALTLILIYLTLVIATNQLFKSNKARGAQWLIRIINVFNLLFFLLAQHIIELFSFIYYIHYSDMKYENYTLFNRNINYLLLFFIGFGIFF